MYKRDVFFDFALPVSINIAELGDSPLFFYQEHIMIIVVVAGKIKVKKYGKEISVTEKQLLLMDSNVPFGIKKSDKTAVILSMNINTAYYKEQFSYLSSTVFSNNVNGPANELLSKVLDCAIALSNNDISLYATVDNRIREILNDILTNRQRFSSAIITNYASEQTRFEYINLMQKIIAYADNSYSENVSLKSFSAKEHLSDNYLSHLIKQISGATFKDIVSFVRCRKSEVQLLDHTKKISRIAYDTGFSSSAYYKNNFLKFYGMSPEEYRTNYIDKTTDNDSLKIYSKKESINILKVFADKHQISMALIPERFFTVDTVHIDRPLEECRNVLSVEGAISNIEAEMNENIHQAFVNMQKEFRMTVITIDAATLIDKDNNRRLVISRNIDYLIHSGFRIVFVLYRISLQQVNAIVEFMNFYNRRFSSTINDITFSIKEKTTNLDVVKYKRMLANKLLEETNLTSKILVDNTYTRGLRFFPALYDSFLLAPFAMDELFNEKKWTKPIDFTLIDSVNENGNIMSGGNGLLSWNGIKKPWWNAYMLVSKLKGSIISKGRDHIITNNNNYIAILTYNTCDLNPSFLISIKSNEQLIDVINNKGYAREHCFQLMDIYDQYKMITYSIDSTSCLFSKWAELGYPDYLTSEEERIIAQICHPKVDFKIINAAGSLSVNTQEDSFGVTCVIIEKIK